MLPEPAPRPRPTSPAARARSSRSAGSGRPARAARQSFFKRRVAPHRRGDPGLPDQDQVDHPAGAEVQAAGHGGHDGGVGRRLRHHLGLPVRRRLRDPAAGPRDGPRDRAAARGHPRQRADVHPLPGRGDQRPLAGRQRGRRGARRPGRAGAGHDRSGRCAWSIWQATGHDYWRALAFTGFFLNLFNLLPVVPLDGGRAMAAMAPWMWFLGFLGMVALAIVFPNPIILIIVVFAGWETYRRWQLRRSGERRAAGLLPGQAARSRC